MDHLPHSPYLQPSDFHLYGPLTNMWMVTNLQDTNIKQAVTSTLETTDTDFFYASVQTLVPQWDKCLTVNGNYSAVYHLLYMYQMYSQVIIKFAASECVSFSKTALYMRTLYRGFTVP
jgi:hypothetical protein